MSDHLDLDTYAQNFGDRPVPLILQQLLHFQNTVGPAYSRSILLDYHERGLSDREFYDGHTHQLITFAYCDSSGDEYVLWDNAGNPDIELWPVIMLDTEGGYTVMARNLAEFISTTWCDRVPYAPWVYSKTLKSDPLQGGYMEADADEVPSKLAPTYKQFLAEELKLDVTQDPDQVVKAAQAQFLADFIAWHRPFEIRFNGSED
jgi:hypothetical protein